MTGDPRETLLLVTLQNVILVGFTIGVFFAGVFVARRFGSSAGYSLFSLGFVRPRGGYLGGVGVGVMVGFGAVLAGALVNALSISVLERFGYSTESRMQQRFMQGLEGWVRESPELAIPAILLVVVLFGPAVEELVFRGGVFNGLNRLGIWIFNRTGAKNPSVTRTLPFVMAALASSGLFALLHLEPVLVASLLILAFVLCVLFEKTGSLLPPFVAHATFNSFAATLIILSGLDALPVPV